VDVDPAGNVWVSEAGNNRVQVFSPQGAFLATFGTFGTGAGQFAYPWDVALGPWGSVLVADESNNRISRWAR
jgi:DNA-binding beta-propeller fold protein YncE